MSTSSQSPAYILMQASGSSKIQLDRSMINVVKLQSYYFPWKLEQKLSRFVDYYNNHRYHEALNNVTPADVYCGRQREILTKRDQVKRKTLALRKQQNLNTRVT